MPGDPARGRLLPIVGPGLLVAATGVGAGDLVAAAVSGSRYGFAIVWAALVGAILKFVLNEGLARWQLASGLTLLEGWALHIGRWLQYLFAAYLVVWSFVVAGALISACGIAAHALAPALSFKAWGILHSLLAAAVVLLGGYRSFERLMGVFVGLMFVTLIGCALWIAPPLDSLTQSVRSAGIPAGAGKYVLGVIGGVGGSVTLLSYGYWIRERGWIGPGYLRTIRIDLAVAYGLTGAFGVAVMVLAARVLHAGGVEIKGSGGVVDMAALLGEVLGPVGHWTFLIGFWGAVATSLLGVWQGIPYLFSDFVALMRGVSAAERAAYVDARSRWNRGFLCWLCLPPLTLLYLDRPVGVIVLYSILGALFMPFLAGTLLYLNGRGDLVGDRKNGGLATAFLLLGLVLFGYIGIVEILEG